MKIPLLSYRLHNPNYYWQADEYRDYAPADPGCIDEYFTVRCGRLYSRPASLSVREGILYHRFAVVNHDETALAVHIPCRVVMPRPGPPAGTPLADPGPVAGAYELREIGWNSCDGEGSGRMPYDPRAAALAGLQADINAALCRYERAGEPQEMHAAPDYYELRQSSVHVPGRYLRQVEGWAEFRKQWGGA